MRRVPAAASSPSSSPTDGANDDARSHRSIVSYLAFMAVVMAVGVDIALPAFREIDDAFGVTPNGGSISLVTYTYFFGMAFGQLVFGPGSDRFGRRPALIVGIVLTAVGALGSALAPSFAWLLVARTVWGFGAASPGVLRTTIARDLFDGDEMARVVSIVMAVFLIGPILIPSIGQLLLGFGSWRFLFVVATAVSAIGLAWTLRFGETLRPEHRRPFDMTTFASGIREVSRNRRTMAFVAAQTFTTGAFQVFLGSGQPIVDRIYGRGEDFALVFGGCGIFVASALVGSNRLIGRFGAAAVLRRATIGLVGLAVAGLAIALGSGGVPPFGAWLLWLALTNATVVAIAPMCNALALEPMGELAGTASALLGFVTLAGGAALASIIDYQIDTTIVPMNVGYVLYGGIALAIILWATAAPGQAAEPAG